MSKLALSRRAFNWFRHGQMGRWIVLGLITGTVSGLFAAGFFYLLEGSTHFIFYYLAGYETVVPAGERIFTSASEPNFRRWVFFLLPVIGGLLSGLVVYFLAPEAEGHGTDAMIEAFHNREGRIRTRVPFVKAVATVLTMAFGGSAGREGPIAQIGGGLGAMVADLFRLPASDRRILLLAGTGGGLGAIFRAPLGGAITALEVIYREDIETDALIPTVISSITAYTIFSQVFGFRTIFDVPRLTFNDPRHLVFYVLLGLICVPVGAFYAKFFYGLRDWFRKLKIPNYLKPMLGGLGVAVIGLFLPQVYSSGWGQLQLALLGQLSLGLMAGIVLFKILATSFTISSGGSGGVFGPTLFIGGMIGGVVGTLAHQLFPGVVSHVDVGAFVLVGMAAFFAGVAHAPLGALLMVTEMTGGYHLIAPLLLVSAIALLFSRRWSIYENQVRNKFNSPAHVGEFTVNVLEEMKVAQIYEPLTDVPRIPATASLAEVQRRLSSEDVEALPVAGEDGTVIGIVSMDTTRPVFFEDGLDQILIAQDLALPAVWVHPHDSLYQALEKFLKYPIAELLVMDEQEPNRILGLLHHRDLIRAYNSEILRRKAK